MPDIAKRNFTGGEIAPALHARADLDKYQNGAAQLKNFLVHPQGGVSNRPGTLFIGEVKDSSKTTRLLPFEFNKDQAYVLEMGDLYQRVIRNDGIVLEAAVTITGATNANPVKITANSHGFSDGDEVFIDGVNGMTEINNRRFIVTNTTSNRFDLQGEDGTGHGVYGGAGTVARLYTLTTPYVEGDLALLKFTQSADTMTIVHPTYQQRNLTRTDHDAWTLTVISYTPTTTAPTGVSATAGGSGGGDHNKTYEYVVTAVSADGDESLASSPATETTNSLDGTHFNDVSWGAVTGADYYNVYKAESETSDIYGWIGESKTTTFRDYNTLPDITDTPAEARDPFSGTDNFPSTVTYYQQRQIFGRTNNNIQTVYATASGNFTSMRLSRPTKADDAIERTIASRKVNEIRHFVDLDSLIVLTSGGEWRVTEGQDDVLTPASVGFRQQTAYGSSHVPPVIVGNSALFVQLGGHKVRDLGYSFQSDSYVGNDLSLIAEHLFEGRTVREWAYQPEPWGVVWVVMSDGALLGLTYQKEHQVWAWHQHETDGLFESVAVIPDGDKDSVYFIVNRTINGQTKRYIEKLDDREFALAEDGFFVDSGLTYSGPAATTITGLDHLEGESVVALADGNVVKNLTVTNGSVTLPKAATKATIGLPYTGTIETLDIDRAEFAVRGKKLSIPEVVVKFLKTRGGKVGPALDLLTEIRPRRISDSYDSLALRTEDIDVALESEWSQNGKLFITQEDPLPMTVLAVVPEINVG